MIIIGERINGMFLDVRKAIQTKDKSVIQELARKQTSCGANYLDVNVGPASDDPKSAIVWLVETIQEVVDTPIAIDVYTKFEVMEAGVKACKKGKVMINSTNGTEKKLKNLIPLAAEWDATIIGLCMDDRGIPSDTDYRVEVAGNILVSAMEHGISADRVFIDPIINPINVSQDQFNHVLASIRTIKENISPECHFVVGLSNVSQGTKKRELINRTALVMLAAVGLDAAIADPMDTELMDAMITTEILLNKIIYNDSYLEAYRKCF